MKRKVLVATCPYCGGVGIAIDTNPCRYCNGNGITIIENIDDLIYLIENCEEFELIVDEIDNEMEVQ